ncbi:MAG: C39 family peptidase [Planctomycetes bacterium]|nr:C39 family peptidase [Planctomycetota bacterium]
MNPRMLTLVSLLLLCAGCEGFHTFNLHGDLVPTSADFPGIERTRSFWNVPRARRAEVDQHGFYNLYTTRLRGFDRVEQSKTYSCWAASAEMVLGFLGRPVSQSEILRTIKGEGIDEGKGYGTGMEIMEALAGDWTHVHYDSGNAAWMAADISLGWPVIIALKNDDDRVGHAVVLTEMTVSWQSTWGQPLAIVHEVVVVDPYPGMGRERWSGEEFKSRLAGCIHMRDYSLPGF